jgi:hypothetical protein
MSSLHRGSRSQVLKILAGGRITNLQRWIDPAATLPNQEPDRTAEAVRRALPELVKLAACPDVPLHAREGRSGARMIRMSALGQQLVSRNIVSTASEVSFDGGFIQLELA